MLELNEDQRVRMRATGIQIRPDPGRVVERLFVPGLEVVGPSGSRAAAVVDRVLRLDEDEVNRLLGDVLARFGPRHRDIEAAFDAHAEQVVSLISPEMDVSPARFALIGACFTHECTPEAAAACNPSMVLMDESPEGGARFLMSLRGIGEGHLSSIAFRTGTISADGTVALDEPSPFATTAPPRPGIHYRSVFYAKLDVLTEDFTNISRLLGTLPPTFDDAALAEALAVATADVTFHPLDTSTQIQLTELSRASYTSEFPDETEVSERVLWPSAPIEHQGMEDARFVRFTEDDGSVTYYATYTAFDHLHIHIQLLKTQDFRRFEMSPIAGAAAEGKGLALFPRRINGRYVALTRSDRESNGIASSDDMRHWPSHQSLQVPTHGWEVLQLGNCGSPIELDEGWLVLTHGVGPMRTYGIGALLLDRDDPTRVIGRTSQPILSPTGSHQDGYVPNVVYSCGGLVHRRTLVLPYGVGDQWIEIATAPVDEILAAMDPA